MNQQTIYKLVALVFLFFVLSPLFFIYRGIYSVSTGEERIEFEVNKGESVKVLSVRLEEEGVIKKASTFRRYVAFKKLDREVQAGTFTVDPPITVARVAAALRDRAEQQERTLTFLPGWDLRDIASYLEEQGIGKEKEVYQLLGSPATKPTLPKIGALSDVDDLPIVSDKPHTVSYEGYLAPDTYRVFTDATLDQIFTKLITQQNSHITDQMYADIRKAGRTIHDVMTIASLVEREVRTDKERAIVADLFWRRFDENWALQADSTVHYAVGKKGDVFTTREDRDSKNEWNTYKYPGLPPGPIAMPSVSSINAAIYPEPNEYSYFLTTLDGQVKYGRTLEEHNANVQRYLR